MKCDCEAMEFDDRAIEFNLNVYVQRCMNTIEATKNGPH